MTRRIRRLAAFALTVALVVLWALFFLPRGMGGSASYLIVSGHSMDPTFATGDLAIVRAQDEYRVGDVVGYKVPEGSPGAGYMVIHRIIGGDGANGFVTRGDNNDDVDMWKPRSGDVHGRLFVHVPHGGDAFLLLRSPVGLGVIAGVFAFSLLFATDPDRPSRRPDRSPTDEALPAT